MAALSYWEKSRIHQALKRLIAGPGIEVDSTTPSAPVVSAKISTDPSNALSFGTDDGLFATGGGGGPNTIQLTFGWDGAGVALVAGQTVRGTAMTAMTITDATVLSDLAGNCTIDIWKDTYANYPPDIADSIVGGSPPALVASDKSVDSALTGWTTSVAAGDTFLCTLSTVSGGITQISVTLGGVKV